MAQTVTGFSKSVPNASTLIRAGSTDREAISISNPHLTIDMWVLAKDGGPIVAGQGKFIPAGGSFELQHHDSEYENWKRQDIYGIAVAAGPIAVGGFEVIKEP